MFYVYVLENEKGDRYIGYSQDLRKRILEHNQGTNFSTKNHEWHCIYYEACTEREDARRREHYFKTTPGRRALRTRLQTYIQQRRKPKLH